MIFEVMARFEFIVYLLAALLIAGLYMAIKRAKMNRLIKNNRMTNAQNFRLGVETSIAISDEGLIGVVNFKLEALIIDIKDILEFEVLLSKYCIASAKASKNEGLIFGGISGRLRPVLEEEKLKEIAFIVALKNDKIFAVNLHKGFRPKKLDEVKQKTITRLFDALEAAERKRKGK